MQSTEKGKTLMQKFMQKGTHTKKKVIGKIKPDCIRPNSDKTPLRVRKIIKCWENVGIEENLNISLFLDEAIPELKNDAPTNLKPNLITL